MIVSFYFGIFHLIFILQKNKIFCSGALPYEEFFSYLAYRYR